MPAQTTSIFMSQRQRAMLTASIRDTQDAPYVLQLSVPFTESVNELDWQNAWRKMAESDSILRSEFDPVSDEFYLNNRLHWQRHKVSAAVDNKLTAIRIAGLSASPSERFELCQHHWIETPEGAVWCLMVHHAVMDGNSFRPLMERLVNAYSNENRFDADGTTDYFQVSTSNKVMVGPAFEPCHMVSCFHQPRLAVDKAVLRLPIVLAPNPNVKARVQTLIHTTWALVLSRALGRSKVTFGVTRHCRDRSLISAIGPYASVVPLTIEVQDELSIEQFLQVVRQDWEALKSIENTTLSAAPGTIVNIIRKSPADEVRIVLGDLCKGDVKFEQRTDIPIALTVELEPKLNAYFTIDRRQISENAARSLASTFESVFHSLGPYLDVLVEGVSLAKTPPPITSKPLHHSIWEQFQDAVIQHPSAAAVKTPSHNHTYSELHDIAERYATALVQAGIETGQVVAIRTGRSFETVAAMLAVVKTGGVFFVFGEDVDDQRAEQLIQQSGACFLVGDCPVKLRDSISIIFPEGESKPSPEAAADIQGSQPAYLVATSGTTGHPKLVVNHHQGLLNLLQGYSDILKPRFGDVRYQAASCGGDTFVLEVILYLTSGAAIYIDEIAIHEGFVEFRRKLEKAGVTVLGLPSSTWKLWAEHGFCSNSSSLRAVICSMERTNPDDLRAWRSNGGDSLLWLNAYGPSEAACVTTIFDLQPGEPVPDAEIPIGIPLPNTEVSVLSPNGQRLPSEFLGELSISGIGVGLGYRNDPNLTAKKFTKDDRGERIYHTGDIGYQRLSDGQFVFVGRRDNQVKVRGFRVELEEVDLALCRHIDVIDSATVAVEIDGRTRLAAFFTSSKQVSSIELQQQIYRCVGKHAIPARIVRRSTIPRNASGKVDRRALAEEADQLFVQPNNIKADSPTSQMQRLFSHVLGVPSVGADDNFFDSGGDSLNSLELLVKLEKEFDHRVSPSELMQNPTPRQLLASLQRTADSRVRHHALVELRTGNGSPLVTCHGWSPSALLNRNLLGSLNPTVSVWGVQGVELAGIPRPTDFTSMCATYASELLDQFGQQPINLFGFSMGGLVAHETSRQVIELGGSVENLFVLDSLPLGLPRRVYWRMQIPYLVARSGYHIPRIVKAPGGRLNYLRRRIGAARNIIDARRKTKDRKISSMKLPPQSYYLGLLGNHVPQPVSIRTHLLTSCNQRRKLIHAWNYLSMGQAQRWELPYDHHQLLKDGADSVGAIISDLLVGNAH